MPTRTLPILLSVDAPEDWTDEDVMDAVRFRLDMGTLNDVETSAHLATPTRAVIDQQFRPGDWAEHRTQDLDPREVVAVGKDWLDLDLSLGGDRPPTRVPLDNYEPGHPRAFGSI